MLQLLFRPADAFCRTRPQPVILPYTRSAALGCAMSCPFGCPWHNRRPCKRESTSMLEIGRLSWPTNDAHARDAVSKVRHAGGERIVAYHFVRRRASLSSGG